ncbi:MAG TPA: terminase [Steroidobacteraceae bacterium]|nr:terminase [Steroidobacteraceae bacterium]
MAAAMTVAQLLAWQWEGYARYHQSRANLVLHIVLVPAFLAGNIALIAGIIRLSWIAALAGLGLMVISMALQGRGRRGESVPPVPFSSLANALGRIFLEQWITFPRFVLGGGWLRALRNARA